ncbi:MAG: hypothetical protein CNLJKLNK_00937 [Holosporales bacterium]
MALKIIRSLVFDALFYIGTAVYLTLMLPVCLFKKDIFVLYKIWATGVLFLLRVVLRCSVRIEGLHHYQEALKSSPVILAIQHQSALDTILPALFFKQFKLIVKYELSKIPLFSTYLKKLDAIFLDRSDGLSALKKMLRDAKAHFEKGESILIFPQGHRALPLESYPVKPGIYALYRHLNCPVVPVSLNTGLFWPRKAFIKKSGEIILTVHPALPLKMDQDALLDHVNHLFSK